jgi:cell division protein FtsQ
LTSTTDSRRPVPAIDPRIRARRIAVQRDEGRRRLHRLGLVGAVAAIALGAVGVAGSPLLDVDGVVVAGSTRLDPAAVVAASGIERGAPLVTLDVGAAVEGVRALPWVADVVVRRSWPGTVEIAVLERQPVAALLGAGGTAALVDADGRVLADVAPEAAGAVLVAGLDGAGRPGSTVPAAARGALDLAAGLPADLLPAVERVVVAPDGDLRLELAPDGGAPATVLLGSPDQLQAKLTALVTVLTAVDLAEVAVLDLAVPSAPALTRR